MLSHLPLWSFYFKFLRGILPRSIQEGHDLVSCAGSSGFENHSARAVGLVRADSLLDRVRVVDVEGMSLKEMLPIAAGIALRAVEGCHVHKSDVKSHMHGVFEPPRRR